MRFYFHTADGSRDRDTEGTELPNFSAARLQAIEFLAKCMADDPQILDDHDFRVEVTDEADLLLLTIVAFAINAPGSGRV